MTPAPWAVSAPCPTFYPFTSTQSPWCIYCGWPASAHQSVYTWPVKEHK